MMPETDLAPFRVCFGQADGEVAFYIRNMHSDLTHCHPSCHWGRDIDSSGPCILCCSVPSHYLATKWWKIASLLSTCFVICVSMVSSHTVLAGPYSLSCFPMSHSDSLSITRLINGRPRLRVLIGNLMTSLVILLWLLQDLRWQALPPTNRSEWGVGVMQPLNLPPLS